MSVTMSFKQKLPFRRTCKDVAALLIAREDRDLSLVDRLALRMHLAICQACPRFERQVLTMRNAMKQWRNYTDEA
ncbi:MAG: zf-HC2 domain-containing protein [Burkholderiaceae bacterium]